MLHLHTLQSYHFLVFRRFFPKNKANNFQRRPNVNGIKIHDWCFLNLDLLSSLDMWISTQQSNDLEATWRDVMAILFYLIGCIHWVVSNHLKNVTQKKLILKQLNKTCWWQRQCSVALSIKRVLLLYCRGIVIIILSYFRHISTNLCANNYVSKFSKIQAAGRNLHGRYLPDQFRVGASTQHDVMTILRSRPKW